MDRFMRKCVMDRKIVQLLIQERSFNKISKQLKVGKKRIRQINNMAKSVGYLDGHPLPEYLCTYQSKSIDRVSFEIESLQLF